MNSRSKTGLSVIVTSLLITALGACYEQSSEVTLHQAGQYQGATDPLLKLTADPSHKKKLEDRFLAIQTDR